MGTLHAKPLTPLQRKVNRYTAQQKAKYEQAQKRKFGSRDHRLGINDQTGLFELDNQLYYGPIYIGSSNQEMQVIFDSASEWLLIESGECETCLGDKYYSESSAFFQVSSGEVVERKFGTIIHLSGVKAIDQVCLVAETVCVNPYAFFMITD